MPLPASRSLGSATYGRGSRIDRRWTTSSTHRAARVLGPGAGVDTLDRRVLGGATRRRLTSSMEASQAEADG